MFGYEENETKETKPLEKVQLKHLIIAFIILGVGCLVASFIFLIEIFCGKKGQQSSSRENQNFEVSHKSDQYNKTHVLDAALVKTNKDNKNA